MSRRVARNVIAYPNANASLGASASSRSGWLLLLTLLVLLVHPGRVTGADAADGALQPARAAPEVESPALAKGTLLVAAEKLRDPNFARSVVFLIDHGEDGAMGVVINQPTDVPLADVLPDLEELKGNAAQVHIGGPVGRNRIVLLIRAASEVTESAHVADDVYVTASQAALREVLARRRAGVAFRAYAGYAGWAPGQLEGEIERGDWHLWRDGSEPVFDADPARIWEQLLRRASGVWVWREAPAATLARACAGRCR